MSRPANDLAVGLRTEMGHEVTPEMVPGHVAGSVLSTPSLIAMIEKTCRRALLPHLPAGADTVGTHVCVSHEAVARVGEEVTVAAELVTVDGRHLTFETRVDGPRGQISSGTHGRAIVDRSRFGSEPGAAS